MNFGGETIPRRCLYQSLNKKRKWRLKSRQLIEIANGDLPDELYGLYTAGSFVLSARRKRASPTERQNDDMAQTGEREERREEEEGRNKLLGFNTIQSQNGRHFE